MFCRSENVLPSKKSRQLFFRINNKFPEIFKERYISLMQNDLSEKVFANSKVSI